MLASTVQFSRNGRYPPGEPAPTHTHPDQQGLRTRCGRFDRPGGPQRSWPQPLPQDPTACQAPTPRPARSFPRRRVLRRPRKPAPTNRCSTHELPLKDERLDRGLDPPTPAEPGGRATMLLRKEVIQPHLPVRLPCYDFVPIASPTFDGSPPQGVGPPASGVTDFRDVTGGVYKARERIHRSVADLRLLATPTSWGRVADPNPN